MFVCPACHRFGYRLDSGKECLCLGWGVLNTASKNNLGTLVRYEPFVEACHRIEMQDVRDAVQKLRVGYTADDDALGVLAVAELLIERGNSFDTDQSGEWLKDVLLHYDAVYLTPNGVWIEQHGEGVCILLFPAETL